MARSSLTVPRLVIGKLPFGIYAAIAPVGAHHAERAVYLARSNDGPRDPPTLPFIGKILCQGVCLPGCEVVQDGRAIVAAEVFCETGRMCVGSELNLFLGLHRAPHGTQGSEQAVLFDERPCLSGDLRDASHKIAGAVVEGLQVSGQSCAQYGITQIDPVAPGEEGQVAADPVALFPGVGGPGLEPRAYAFGAYA